MISGCLVEEHFKGRLGYEAIAFTYLDPVTLRWYRSAADNLGERVELEGDFVGAALVRTGMEKAPGGDVQYRLTLTPVSGRVEAKHEISRDGGATWVTPPTLSYLPGLLTAAMNSARARSSLWTAARSAGDTLDAKGDRGELQRRRSAIGAGS